MSRSVDSLKGTAPGAEAATGEPPGSPRRAQLKAGLLCLLSIFLAGLTVVLVFTRTALPREAAFMSGIFVLAALLWVTEALPLFATSLL